MPRKTAVKLRSNFKFPQMARMAAAAVVTFGCAMTPAAAQQKLQIAGNFASEHPSSVAVEQVFKKEVARLTNNQLQVDVFPAMQLGGAKENVDAVRSGTLALTWVGAAFLSRIAPELEAVSLPFVFSSRETAFRVIDGPVGDAIDKKLQAKGFVSLGWMELGMRHITNSRGPIKTMADLKGLKVRLQPNETHLNTFRALGANPVAMDVKELYSALEQHVVDAQENPYTVISAARYGEVQKHLSNSGHFFDLIAVVASRKAFDQLKPEHQKAIREAMTSTIAFQRKLAAEDESKRLAELKSKMTYTEIPAASIDEMRRATAPVIEDVKKRAGAELVNQVLAEVAKR
jgi:tripartite ATP-independent transporter DctP family solute receptor